MLGWELVHSSRLFDRPLIAGVIFRSATAAEWGSYHALVFIISTDIHILIFIKQYAYMYALVPAPIPPAIDSKLNPHVDTQKSKLDVMHISMHLSIEVHSHFFKDKKKGSLQPNTFGT